MIYIANTLYLCVKENGLKKDLVLAAIKSFSIRQIIAKLGLRAAGGNYVQVQKYLLYYKIDTSHFKGKGWNKGLQGTGKPLLPMANILKINSDFQSYKLKKDCLPKN